MLLTAAGNTGRKSSSFPENHPNQGVVSVTGLNSDETTRDSVASVADTLKYAAPFDVYSTTSYSYKYRDLTGTSFSPCHVSFLEVKDFFLLLIYLYNMSYSLLLNNSF